MKCHDLFIQSITDSNLIGKQMDIFTKCRSFCFLLDRISMITKYLARFAGNWEIFLECCHFSIHSTISYSNLIGKRMDIFIKSRSFGLLLSLSSMTTKYLAQTMPWLLHKTMHHSFQFSFDLIRFEKFTLNPQFITVNFGFCV